jgi:cold shock CspA family protein
MARETGVVRRWFAERALGFICSDTGDNDVFVHLRSLQGGLLSLNVGQRVSFVRGEDKRTGRPEARDVRADTDAA